eukprot:TRINITY_DN11067_c0_g1_i2.p1 TRINITY_DN11067_c0_g1~~TRINITY_DN11067_c0_g1_i2.p1  ORF type:complete len:125 (-),score=8.45 TRINITY_DN11067_c0_g1_i2:46-420(-)
MNNDREYVFHRFFAISFLSLSILISMMIGRIIFVRKDIKDDLGQLIVFSVVAILIFSFLKKRSQWSSRFFLIFDISVWVLMLSIDIPIAFGVRFSSLLGNPISQTLRYAPVSYTHLTLPTIYSV